MEFSVEDLPKAIFYFLVQTPDCAYSSTEIYEGLRNDNVCPDLFNGSRKYYFMSVFKSMNETFENVVKINTPTNISLIMYSTKYCRKNQDQKQKQEELDKIRQEEIKLEEIRLEELKQEELRRKEIQLEQIRQSDIRQGEIRQGEIRQGEIRQGEIRQGDIKSEEMRLEELRLEEMRQRKIKQDEKRQLEPEYYQQKKRRNRRHRCTHHEQQNMRPDGAPAQASACELTLCAIFIFICISYLVSLFYI